MQKQKIDVPALAIRVRQRYLSARGSQLFPLQWAVDHSAWYESSQQRAYCRASAPFLPLARLLGISAVPPLPAGAALVGMEATEG